MPMIWQDAEDHALARSIFGNSDPAIVERLILSWASEHGMVQASVASVEMSIGAGVALLQPGGSRTFVWPGQTNPYELTAQTEVQRRMASRGYLASVILTSLDKLGPGWAIVMSCNRNGYPTDVRFAGVRRNMAFGFAREPQPPFFVERVYCSFGLLAAFVSLCAEPCDVSV